MNIYVTHMYNMYIYYLFTEENAIIVIIIIIIIIIIIFFSFLFTLGRFDIINVRIFWGWLLNLNVKKCD